MKPICVPTTPDALIKVGEELDGANYIMNASEDRDEIRRAKERAIECERAISASPLNIDEDGNVEEKSPCPLQDGEVLGLEDDGSVIQWDADESVAYNSGESLEEFGIANLAENERIRVGLAPSEQADSMRVG